jgi:hypothetical protein
MDIFDLALNLDVDYLPAYPLQRHSAPRSGFLLHSVPVFSACSSPAWFLLLAEDLLDIRLRRIHTHTHTHTHTDKRPVWSDSPRLRSPLLSSLPPAWPACMFFQLLLRTQRPMDYWINFAHYSDFTSLAESKLMMPCLLFLASVSSLFFKWANERLN